MDILVTQGCMVYDMKIFKVFTLEIFLRVSEEDHVRSFLRSFDKIRWVVLEKIEVNTCMDKWIDRCATDIKP